MTGSGRKLRGRKRPEKSTLVEGRHDEGAENDRNYRDGSVVGPSPATTNLTSPETGQRDEIPPKTVGNVGGETDQKRPGGATEVET